MYKLLVEAPTGQQEIVEIAESGGYFDPARVLWDERTDGELPEIVLGGMVRSGDTLVFSQELLDSRVIATPVPAAVSMAAARDVLIDAGLLFAVEAAIAAIPDAVTCAKARSWWEYATRVRRDSPWVAMLAPALNLDDAALDDLFRAAAVVEREA